MPQDLFNLGAVTIARIHLLTGKTIELVAAECAAAYRNDYVADGFESEWMMVAPEIIVMLRPAFPSAEGLAMAIRQIQYCAGTFHPDGSRIRKWFNGTWFNKGKSKAVDRVEKCKGAVANYLIGSLAGKFPKAPDNFLP